MSLERKSNSETTTSTSVQTTQNWVTATNVTLYIEYCLNMSFERESNSETTSSSLAQTTHNWATATNVKLFIEYWDEQGDKFFLSHDFATLSDLKEFHFIAVELPQKQFGTKRVVFVPCDLIEKELNACPHILQDNMLRTSIVIDTKPKHTVLRFKKPSATTVVEDEYSELVLSKHFSCETMSSSIGPFQRLQTYIPPECMHIYQYDCVFVKFSSGFVCFETDHLKGTSPQETEQPRPYFIYQNTREFLAVLEQYVSAVRNGKYKFEAIKAQTIADSTKFRYVLKTISTWNIYKNGVPDIELKQGQKQIEFDHNGDVILISAYQKMRADRLEFRYKRHRESKYAVAVKIHSGPVSISVPCTVQDGKKCHLGKKFKNKLEMEKELKTFPLVSLKYPERKNHPARVLGIQSKCISAVVEQGETVYLGLENQDPDSLVRVNLVCTDINGIFANRSHNRASIVHLEVIFSDEDFLLLQNQDCFFVEFSRGFICVETCALVETSHNNFALRSSQLSESKSGVHTLPYIIYENREAFFQDISKFLRNGNYNYVPNVIVIDSEAKLSMPLVLSATPLVRFKVDDNPDLDSAKIQWKLKFKTLWDLATDAHKETMSPDVAKAMKEIRPPNIKLVNVYNRMRMAMIRKPIANQVEVKEMKQVEAKDMKDVASNAQQSRAETAPANPGANATVTRPVRYLYNFIGFLWKPKPSAQSNAESTQNCNASNTKT